MKLYTKFERNRAIRGAVIAISPFDLMTLNMFHLLTYDVVAYSFTKFKLSQPCNDFGACWYVMSRCDLDLWPFTRGAHPPTAM